MTRKIAFVSPHCLVDYTNGAATATRDGLRLLAEQGFQCRAFCGTRLDEASEGLIQEQLFRRKIDYEVRKVRIGGQRQEVGGQRSAVGSQYDARLIFLAEGRISVTLFENGSTRGGWFGPREVNTFLAGCDMFLRKNRPDVVVTYGGDPVSLAVQRLAKRHGAVVVFWLHNFAYADKRAFEAVDHIIVPSEFSRRYYRERLGLECHVLPNVVNWQAAEVGGQRSEVGGRRSEKGRCAGSREQGVRTASFLVAPSSPLPARYLTFINPQEIKGVYVFARIARELARRRPDIPILVTQGRSRGDALKNPALGLAPHLIDAARKPVDAASSPHDSSGETPLLRRQFPIEPTSDGRNITVMPFTPDPRDFYPAVYANTKLLLMPSLWLESFGLVAAEAMLNGIPVLASDRGALPETVGERTHLAPRDVGNGRGAQPHLAERDEYAAGGFLFDIPARYTPETREVPTAEEVEPWIETIIRLWDDAGEYDHISRAARERAQQWHPDRLATVYRDFFSRITHQPGPPLVPASARHDSVPSPFGRGLGGLGCGRILDL